MTGIFSLGLFFQAGINLPAGTNFGMGSKEDKPIVLNQEDIKALDACLIRAATLFGPKSSTSPSSVIEQTIAKRILNKFSDPTDNPKVIEQVVAKIREVSSPTGIRFASLVSAWQRLSWRSYCNTRSAWYTPTYGEPPGEIALKITVRDVKKILSPATPPPAPPPPKVTPPPPPPPSPQSQPEVKPPAPPPPKKEVIPPLPPRVPPPRPKKPVNPPVTKPAPTDPCETNPNAAGCT